SPRHQRRRAPRRKAHVRARHRALLRHHRGPLGLGGHLGGAVAHASGYPIARALVSDDVEERRQATAELARLPLDEALPLLLVSLGDDDWRVRKEATYAARASGGAKPLVDALVGLFTGGENVGLRNAAVDVLADAGHTATIALSEVLPRLDADGRKLA